MTAVTRAGALVLAGGKGTRMYSSVPKVLMRILEEPILRYVYTALSPQFGEAVWTIIGYGADAVRHCFPDFSGKMVLQEEQLGTGHALSVAWPHLEAAGLSHVLVINGDTPQIPAGSLERFCAACQGNTESGPASPADIGFMSLTLETPGSFGRVVRKGGEVHAIIEAKDYQADLHGPEPREVNAGIYWISLAAVSSLLPLLKNDNKNKEFYITDLIGLAVERGMRVAGIVSGTDARLNGVNSPLELVAAEEAIRAQIVAGHLANGVLIRQPESVRISPLATIDKGAAITGPCEIYGPSSVACGATIDSHCKLENSRVGTDVHLKSYSYLQDSDVGQGAIVGPYARLRPGAVLEESSHVGNFVEIKKSLIRKGAKVNHLTYIGDADIGEKTNVGAGTSTCNYDGVNNHRTVVGRESFIGSNTSLVAPIEIGERALIGAGSVITKPVPDDHLGIARGKQVTLRRKKTTS